MFAVIITISLFYFLVAPFLELIEYNIALAVMVFTVFNLFRFIVYIVGYIFTYIDKPMRDYSYTPLVSVMIPARNEEKAIAENIKAVNAAAGKYLGNVELIIIDDKSTDNTRNVVEETFCNCNNFVGRLITGPGKGKSAAMNFGLEHANGEVVLNLDSDTIITEDAIKELVPYFTDPLVGGVGCHVEQKDEVGLLRKLFAIELLYLFGLVKPGQQGTDSIMVVIGGSSMYRTEVLREIGGWGPIKSGDDGDMTLRVGRYGYKIIQYKEKALARSEIFSDMTGWFIQRTRWYIAFFYTHARNFTAVKDRQGGLRATYHMPLVYVGSFTRFTTLLFTEITILMGIAAYIQSGFKDIELGGVLALVVNPMMIVLILLGFYYKQLRKLPYFLLWPIYSYLSTICSFRSLMVVMGDEGWESKASV
jgi:cellulose synthase/poly-beta-1,6-N-acetylglucosamine synthase-like glycosyltransferase